jgi:hypothetical protein
MLYKRSMSLARGAYQPAQQRSPVIEDASRGAGAPIYMKLRRFTFRQQQICYFFPVDHQRGSWVGRSAASGALENLVEHRGQARSRRLYFLIDQLEACHESSNLNMYDDYRWNPGRQRTRRRCRLAGSVVYLDGIFATGLMNRTAEALAMDVTGVKQVIDLAGISK